MPTLVADWSPLRMASPPVELATKPLAPLPIGHPRPGETALPKILRLSRPPVDADWLTTELADLERLADEGDTLEVVAKLGAIVRAPKRETVPGPAIPVPATPAEVSSGSEALPRTEA